MYQSVSMSLLVSILILMLSQTSLTIFVQKVTSAHKILAMKLQMSVPEVHSEEPFKLHKNQIVVIAPLDITVPSKVGNQRVAPKATTVR